MNNLIKKQSKVIRTICLCAVVMSMVSLCACGSSDSASSALASNPESSAVNSNGSVSDESTVPVDVEDGISEVDEPDNDVPQYPEGFSVLLTNTTGFSEGLAWIQYTDENGITKTSVMDTEGNIRFTLDETPKYMSDFHEGTAFYTIKGTETDVLVDSEGNELYRTHGDENDTVKIEHICGYANGFYLLAREESGISAKGTKIALLKPDGSMSQDYTNAFTCIDSYATTDSLLSGLAYSDDFNFRGKGWYQTDTRWINFDRMEIGRVSYGNHKTVSDYLTGDEIVTTDGAYLSYFDDNLQYTGQNRANGHPKEMLDGIFFSSDIGEGNKYTHGYYDVHLNLVISVDEYPDNYIYCSPFYGDYATMEIRGADGKNYLTVIDKNGKQMFEPMTYQGYYPRMLDGYLLVQNDAGEYAIYDHDGTYLHSVDKDFPDCAVSIEMRDLWNGSDTYDQYKEGWIKLDYTYNGEKYCRLYPVTKAAEAGNEIYDLGVLTPPSVESTDDISNDESTAPKNYVRLNNFKIEGKWKSVGSYGFGQAQPGAIVVFDGNNCNFFSPQDTYALYQDGDNYKLDTTSFMSTDTLTFTIKTIDEDHIDVFYGNNITELERVG